MESLTTASTAAPVTLLPGHEPAATPPLAAPVANGDAPPVQSSPAPFVHTPTPTPTPTPSRSAPRPGLRPAAAVPAIHISIDRIDIHAPATPAPPPPAARRAPPTLPLAELLRRRDGRG